MALETLPKKGEKSNYEQLFVRIIFILMIFGLSAIVWLASSCATSNKVTNWDDCLFVTDYLILQTEQQAEEAENYFFQLGIEIEYEEGFYDNKPVYLIEVQDLDIYDYEIDGQSIFPNPEWYKRNTIKFCIE